MPLTCSREGDDIIIRIVVREDGSAGATITKDGTGRVKVPEGTANLRTA